MLAPRKLQQAASCHVGVEGLGVQGFRVYRVWNFGVGLRVWDFRGLGRGLGFIGSGLLASPV